MENTAAVFATLAQRGSRGMLIRARDAAAVRELPWPEDEAARVGADIDAGYMAVVPRQAVLINNVQHVGWWRIDPLTGETVGVMDSGYNSTTEGGTLQSQATRAYFALVSLFVVPLTMFVRWVSRAHSTNYKLQAAGIFTLHLFFFSEIENKIPS